MSNAGLELASLQAGGGRIINTTTQTLENGTVRTTYTVQVDKMNPDGSAGTATTTVIDDKPRA